MRMIKANTINDEVFCPFCGEQLVYVKVRMTYKYKGFTKQSKHMFKCLNKHSGKNTFYAWCSGDNYAKK